MTRKSLLVLVLMATGLVATHARQDAKPEAKPDAKVGRRRSHRTDDPLAFDTSEGTWMNVDVSPDGTGRLRPARRCLSHADRRRGGARQAPHERARVRHAASLQPRWQTHRAHERP